MQNSNFMFAKTSTDAADQYLRRAKDETKGYDWQSADVRRAFINGVTWASQDAPINKTAPSEVGRTASVHMAFNYLVERPELDVNVNAKILWGEIERLQTEVQFTDETNQKYFKRFAELEAVIEQRNTELSARNKEAPLPLDPDSPMTGAMLHAFVTTEFQPNAKPSHIWGKAGVELHAAWNKLAYLIQCTRNAALESMTEQRNKLRDELSEQKAINTRLHSEQAVTHTENGQLRRDLRQANDRKAFIEQKFADGSHFPGDGEILHDRYVIAALPQCIEGARQAGGDNSDHTVIKRARDFADECIRQRR